MKMGNQNLVKETQAPHLQVLIDEMDSQLKWYDEMLSKLYSTVNKIQTIPPPSGCDQAKKEIDSTGYVGLISRQTDHFRSMNRAFESVLAHLQTCA